MASQLFVNLPVRDLNKAVDFFARLGFKFNPQFTDENATCMIIGENIFVMLLVENFFRKFTSKQICDTSKNTEAILAVTAESQEKVDEIIGKVIKAGGREPRAAQDHGWMYSRSFEDLDGHGWEVFWMDPSKMPGR